MWFMYVACKTFSFSKKAHFCHELSKLNEISELFSYVLPESVSYAYLAVMQWLAHLVVIILIVNSDEDEE